MNLVFVFMLASGSIFFQPQSELNCAKLAAAFARGEMVTAKIKGKDVPIVQGVCIKAEEDATMRVLRNIAIELAPTS